MWDLRDALRSVSDIAAYNTGTGANLTRDASEPLRVTTSQASAELLPMLGVKPALGRLFNADEDKPGRERVALLTFGFWKTQMAADAAVVGRDIQLNGQATRSSASCPTGSHSAATPTCGCHSRSIARGRTIAATTTSKCSRV